jgi:hypothetical protein
MTRRPGSGSIRWVISMLSVTQDPPTFPVAAAVQPQTAGGNEGFIVKIVTRRWFQWP